MVLSISRSEMITLLIVVYFVRFWRGMLILLDSPDFLIKKNEKMIFDTLCFGYNYSTTLL